jgi:cytochrome c oxidase subunit II
VVGAGYNAAFRPPPGGRRPRCLHFARPPFGNRDIIDMTSRVEPHRPGADATGSPAAHPRAGAAARLRRRAAGVLTALVLAPLAACGGVDRFPQTSLVPKSDFAEAIDRLQWLTIYLGVGVSVVVFALLGYILVRFRHQPGAPAPQQVHGNTKLELAWTLIPAILIAIIAVPTVRVIFETQAEAPEGSLPIDVIGYQWWWEFRYPMPNGDTVVTANEVHVPVGRTVELRITAADVLHSFWIPQMGGKRDLIPNRINRIVFTPNEAGVYLGQCAEFCGESHALMKMRLIAHEPAEFERWLANEALPAVEPTDSAVMIGKQLTTQGACAGCHIIDGTAAQFGRAGPNLTHMARRSTIAAGILDNNAENLFHWIDRPTEIKPGSLMPSLGLSEQEIRYIVAYLQTLY